MLPVNRQVMHLKNSCNGQVVQIRQLTKDRTYPVLTARRLSAPYEHTVMFTLSTEGDILLRIYLPRRYANDIDNDETGSINQGRINYKLMYLGMAGQAYLQKLIL